FFVAGIPGAVLALALLFLKDPPRGALDVARPAGDGDSRSPQAASARPTFGALRDLARRPSFIYNSVAQIIYTFGVRGLAVWMPTYFVRERGLPLASAATAFGGVLALAGFVGTLIGGRVGDRMARERPDGHFVLSGVALIASLPFTLLA